MVTIGVTAPCKPSQRIGEIAEAPSDSPCNDVHMDVLLVEDDDSIAIPLAEGLRREGFDVVRAATGEEALSADKADIVLLDLAAARHGRPAGLP